MTKAHPLLRAALLFLLTCAWGCVTPTGERSEQAGIAETAAPSDSTLAPNRLTAAQALAQLKAENDRYWQNARKEVYKSALEILAQHQAELERGLGYRKLIGGDPTEQQIALTFDDGPHPDYTPQILAILRRYRVRATFFLVGRQAEKHPGLVRAEMTAGHNVGNHTYHHVSLIKIPEEYVADEIKTCGEVLRGITGKAPHLFRPPGGEYDREVAEASEVLGYTMVLWTDDPGDYASPGERLILSRTLKAVSKGGIILIHDGIQQTVNVLPQMIQALQQQGYQFVTIDEMLAVDRKGRDALRPLRPVP